MEPERSLPHSQVPATCPYPEPARSSPYPHIPLPEDHFPRTATLSTSLVVRKPTSRLHNSETNSDTYRQITQGKIKLATKT